jgi:hypothetical protein
VVTGEAVRQRRIIVGLASQIIEKRGKPMDLDSILTKVSDAILTLQKLTNIWVWQVTEDVRPEDMERALLNDENVEEQREERKHRWTIRPRSNRMLWWILNVTVLILVFIAWYLRW